MTYVNPTDINADFSDDTEPQDDTLLHFLKLAYTHQTMCRDALVQSQAVRPFSDFKPSISNAFRADFADSIAKGKVPPLYVYLQDAEYIMSDDYAAYYLYRELGAAEIPCVILNPPQTPFMARYISDLYHLPLPSVEILGEE